MNELLYISCASLLILTIIYEFQRTIRKAREKFKRELQGYKFGSLKELKDHWRPTMTISFGKGDNEFDPNYHGNLLETLRIIDEAVKQEVIRWNS